MAQMTETTQPLQSALGAHGSGRAGASIHAKGITKVYGQGGVSPFHALGPIDLDIKPGEFVSLIGPSGCGKSTTLAALAGLAPLATGRIDVCGQPLDDRTADAWRARIALVPQRPHFADTTLGEWLDPKGAGTDPWPALRLADAARVVEGLPEGLAARLGATGGGVSGGEARRLMLARAVLQGGDLILADEPTADLDPETAQRVIAALERLRASGRAVIVATHDPVLAAAMQRQVEIGA